MIVVTVHLVSAQTGKVSEIGRMHISNVAVREEGSRCDYDVKVMKRDTKAKVQRSGEVKNWPRESYSVWRLVCRALKSAFSEE